MSREYAILPAKLAVMTVAGFNWKRPVAVFSSMTIYSLQFLTTLGA